MYISLLFLLLNLLGLIWLIDSNLLLLDLCLGLVLVDLDHVFIHEDMGKAYLLWDEFATFAPELSDDYHILAYLNSLGRSLWICSHTDFMEQPFLSFVRTMGSPKSGFSFAFLV